MIVIDHQNTKASLYKELLLHPDFYQCIIFNTLYLGIEDEFDFKPEEYSMPLQLVYHLLVRNAEIVDADMRFYLIDSVRLLALQCDVLTGAQKKQRKFLKWCQESLLTGVMWKILESAHSQVSSCYTRCYI